MWNLCENEPRLNIHRRDGVNTEDKVNDKRRIIAGYLNCQHSDLFWIFWSVDEPQLMDVERPLIDGTFNVPTSSMCPVLSPSASLEFTQNGVNHGKLLLNLNASKFIVR